jgi:hypothetical protein
MQVFELKDPKVMGEEDPKYGYTFWSLTDGDYPVMFNSKNGNILPGTRLMAEVANLKTSKNGTEYLRLSKTKIEDNPTDSKEQIPFTEKPKPTFGKSNDAFLKDVTNTPILMYNGSLNYAKETGLNLISDKEDRRAYLEYVTDITHEMLSMIDNIRNGVKTPSLKKQWDNVTKKEPTPSDEDMPPEEWM